MYIDSDNNTLFKILYIFIKLVNNYSMKRLVCILFLLILLCVGVVFKNKTINVFSQIPAQKIMTTSNVDDGEDIVLNGNKVISYYNNFNNINIDCVDGVTFEVDKDFNVSRFMRLIGLYSSINYVVDDIKIIEGELIFNNNLNFNSVQIAIKNDSILIGFPSILEGF